MIQISFQDAGTECKAQLVNAGPIDLKKSSLHVLLLQSRNGCVAKDAVLEVASSSQYIRCNGSSETGINIKLVTPPGQRDFAVCSVLYGTHDRLKATFKIKEPSALRASELALEVEP